MRSVDSMWSICLALGRWWSLNLERLYQRQWIRMFAHMWARDSCHVEGPCQVRPERLNGKFAVCSFALFKCFANVGVVGTQRFFQRFWETPKRPRHSNQALKRAPVAQPVLPWWCHALIPTLPLMSQLLISWTGPSPKTCWSLRPLSTDVMTPLSSSPRCSSLWW